MICASRPSPFALRSTRPLGLNHHWEVSIMKRVTRMIFWVGLLVLSVGYAQAADEVGALASWAGSYDGVFTLDGQTIAGTTTFILRQNGDTLTGQFGHE